MKTLKATLVAALFVVSFSGLRAEVSAQAQLESYYLNPSPAGFSSLVIRLSRDGYFEKTGAVPVAIGFISSVFASNPDRVDGWMADFSRLPARHQRLVAAALWQSGHPAGANAIASLARDVASPTEPTRLAQTDAIPVLDTPVLSVSSLNLQWGAFLATGDEHYIVNILQAVGSERPGLDSAALYALARSAAAHPRVAEICRAQLAKQSGSVRTELQTALDYAATHQPGA